MSVEPGYGGQKYIDATDDKIKKIKDKYPNLIIEVDGGVNFEVIKKDTSKLVDEFVIGSLITNSNNLEDVIDKIREELI